MAAKAKPEFYLDWDRQARFWSNVNRNGPLCEWLPELGPCWLWKKSTNADGYGQFRCESRVVQTHIIAWELIKGPRPIIKKDGEDVRVLLDHLCRNRRCCNPAHLQPVDTKTNTLRGERHGAAVLMRVAA